MEEARRHLILTCSVKEIFVKMPVNVLTGFLTIRNYSNTSINKNIQIHQR